MAAEVSPGEATSYDKRSRMQEDMGTKLMNMLSVQNGNTVLDLGCGTGYLAKLLSDKVGPEGKVVAVDPDGERLKIAREKHFASNIEYIQADDQTFPSGQYDLVFANQVIHWIPDQKAVLKRVYDNLRPGGQFAFTTDVDNSRDQPGDEYLLMNKLLGPGVFQDVISSRMNFLSIEEYNTMSVNCGYSGISSETDTQTHEWKTLDDVIETAHGWLQGAIDFSKLDKHVIQEVRKECEEKDGPALRMFRTYLYIILIK